MNGRYYKSTKDGLKYIDPEENSFAYDIEADFAVDPIEEISANQISIMEGLKNIHASLSWIKVGVFILVACELYRYLD